MKAFIVLLIALFAFVAISEARPIAYAAALTGAGVNAPNGDIGVAYALVGNMHGNRQRVRIFGLYSNTANADIGSVWVASATGTRFIQVPIASANSTALNGGRHFYVSTFFNDTHSALTSNSLYINVYDKTGAALFGGPLTSAPRTGITQLMGSSVVPAQTNAFTGLGFFQITDPALTSSDLVQSYTAFYTSFTSESAIVHDVTDATSAALFGNSNATRNGDSLLTLTGANQYAYQKGVATNSDFYGIDYYANYFTVGTAATPAGVIRGNLIPVAKQTRSLSITGVEAQFGTITGDATVQTIKKANNWRDPTKTQAKSSLVLNAVADPVSGAITFVGTFTFNNPVGRKVNETLRGFKLETYFTASSADLWEISVLNNKLNSYLVWGTYSSAATTFQYGETHWFSDPSQFVSDSNEIVVRITSNPAAAASLTVDQLNLQAFVPNARAAKLVKSLAKNVASKYTYTTA